MSYDKLADSTQLDTDLTAVANAIRAKSGGSGQLAFPADFVSEIQAISGGGGTLDVIQELTLTEAVRAVRIDIPSGYDWAYVLIKGEFAEENWVYWGVNQSSANNYSDKVTQISTGVTAVAATNNVYAIGPNFQTNKFKVLTASLPLSYIHVRGYSKDFEAGTKFYAYGGKYADM